MRRITRLYAENDDIRNATPRAEIAEKLRDPGAGLAQIVETVMVGYADRPALGTRATELRTGESGRTTLSLLPEFDTITYGELWERVRAVAAA
jgi:fatty acid CoA ligase FadD9